MTTMSERASDLIWMIIWMIITGVAILAVVTAVVVGFVAMISWVVAHAGQILFIAFLALLCLILL